MNTRSRLSIPLPHLPAGARLPLIGLGGRLLRRGAVLLALAVVGLFAVWFLTYGLTPRTPGEVSIPSLRQPAQIGWFDDGSLRIDAGNELDAATALGYAHATAHLWPMTLWRQTALGALTSWFGADLLELDRFAREMRFEALARETFRALPEEHQAYLRAYASGINAAFEETAFLTRDEFALLEVSPARWRPWHTLAVERLMAWLAVRIDDEVDRIDEAPESLRRFARSDRELRVWLQLHDFDYSFAWVFRDSSATVLGQRHVAGAATTPLFVETIVHTPNATRLVMSVPGTAIAPAGRGPSGAWAALLHGSAHIDRASIELARQTPVYHERIEGRNGVEFLHTFRPGNGYLPFFPAPDSAGVIPDSVWTLFWRGLEQGSDLPRWQAMPDSVSDSFLLFDLAGIHLASDGKWRVFGTPSFVVDDDSMAFVGHSAWTIPLAQRLATEGVGQRPFDRWLEDCYSPWAADLVPRLIAVANASDRLTALELDALTYLRNWDFTFGPASIGASIFEQWLGMLDPRRPISPDAFLSLPTDSVLLAAFGAAANRLAIRLGDDLSLWRLEEVRPMVFNYPAWSFSGAFSVGGKPLSETRYAPLALPGRGHPSALCWGSFESRHGHQTSATWDAWTTASAGDTLFTRRRSLDASGFLGRYRIPVLSPEPRRLHLGNEPASWTQLVPGR
jgi:hypothetical protein